ncbi:MAG TPA: FkbM family methyltransferase [Bryobacteraceae bacterium]|nr:FkbM family methyltransferase [Bryobacteraceae bacterium]
MLDGDAKIVREPYLSLVVTARNDDHGGNLLGRMQIFVDGWLAQARRYNIPSELIIVEWNPPAGRPPLAEALHWPADTGPCEVRIITVPPQIHSRFEHGANLPLYQMIGKNVGIRRARGRFILATNIDILFSNELAAFLGSQQLRTDRMYRIDRHDAMSDVPAGAPIEEQLAYCRTHLIRVNRREGTFEVAPDGSPALSAHDIAAAGSGILFGAGWFSPERFGPIGCFRWAQEQAEILLESSADAMTRLDVDLEPGPATCGRPLDLEVLKDDGTSVARFTIDTRTRLQLTLPAPPPPRLVFRALGKFASPNANPRFLCFRIFSLARDLESTDTPSTPQAVLETPSRSSRMLVWWRSLQYVIRKLAHGGPLVSLTIPISPKLQRVLKNYVERGGFTGMLRGTKAPATLQARVEPAIETTQEMIRCPDFLHTNGCGDFTLLAREKWFDLRGYPEWDIFSMNIDSVFCFTAHYGGAREEVLAEPMRIYHIEHGSGSGWTPEGQKSLFDRIAAKGIPILDNEDVLQWGAQMRRLNSPMIFNEGNWGLKDLTLEETVLGDAAREQNFGMREGSRPRIKPTFHPAFEFLPDYSGDSEPGFEIDFLGIRTRCEFLAGAARIAMPIHLAGPHEDYLEWVDVLESVMAAKGQFTMMELGAGYGRWSVRAAVALRQLRRLPFHLVAVEAEPRHYCWLQQHMFDNHIPFHACTLIQGVVGDHRGDVLFYVGTPSSERDEAASWYGQAVVQPHETADELPYAAYGGQDAVRLKSGWTSIKTHSYLLTDILPATERIDLIDIDIQGEEFKVISAAIDALDQRVVRLRIGTHAHEIETELRQLLVQHGWECKADYPGAQTNQTPWGPVEFVDGVQTWVNPRVLPGS